MLTAPLLFGPSQICIHKQCHSGTGQGVRAPPSPKDTEPTCMPKDSAAEWRGHRYGGMRSGSGRRGFSGGSPLRHGPACMRTVCPLKVADVADSNCWSGRVRSESRTIWPQVTIAHFRPGPKVGMFWGTFCASDVSDQLRAVFFQSSRHDASGDVSIESRLLAKGSIWSRVRVRLPA